MVDGVVHGERGRLEQRRVVEPGGRRPRCRRAGHRPTSVAEPKIVCELPSRRTRSAPASATGASGTHVTVTVTVPVSVPHRRRPCRRRCPSRRSSPPACSGRRGRRLRSCREPAVPTDAIARSAFGVSGSVSLASTSMSAVASSSVVAASSMATGIGADDGDVGRGARRGAVVVGDADLDRARAGAGVGVGRGDRAAAAEHGLRDHPGPSRPWPCACRASRCRRTSP